MRYWRLVIFILVVLGLIAGLVWGGLKLFGGKNKSEIKVYDAAIQLRDRTNADPVEDARSSAKKGDVILVRETGREWSDTEKVSYLIIKIKLNSEQAQKIVQTKTKNISKEEAKEKGKISDEMLKDMKKEELKSLLEEDILFREYYVDIDKLGLDLGKVQSEKKIPDEEFDWKIVKKK